jgi:hypothetical protein
MVTATQLDRPIFIVGTVRSGTTLLAKSLGEHPAIQWGRDGDFELSSTWHRESHLKFGVPGLDCVDCSPAGESQTTNECCERVHAAFAKIHECGAGSSNARFLNKNPHLWNKLPFVRKAFPGACLIVTSRDVRSTVLSTQLLWMRLEKQHGLCHYLPRNPECCWSCIAAADACHYDPKRTFPGGDVAVLAEYWLRTYETIDAHLDDFETLLLVEHRRFVENPEQSLSDLHAALDLPPVAAPPETEIDPRRNHRWKSLLTSREQEQLDGWVDRHRRRIRALRSADTTC